jgi:hypothetical protein
MGITGGGGVVTDGGGGVTTGSSIMIGASTGGVHTSHDVKINTPAITLNNFNFIINPPMLPQFQTIGI